MRFLIVLAACAACATRPGIEDKTNAPIGSGGKADGTGLSDAEALSLVTLVNYADADLLRDIGLADDVAANIVGHRAGADGKLGDSDDMYYVDLADLDAVPNVGDNVAAALLDYARQHDIVDLMTIVEQGLDAGTPPRYITPDEANAIIAAPQATTAVDALRSFYVTSPMTFSGIDPWVGMAPRRTPLLDSAADQIIEQFLTGHGVSGSDVLEQKFIAEPPAELPTPPTTGQTTGRFSTGVSSGDVSFPTSVLVAPSGNWHATYQESAGMQYLRFSTDYLIEIDLDGPDLRSLSTGFAGSAEAGESTLTISDDGWSTNSARVKFQVLELDLDPTTSEVEHAVIAWNRLEDLRYGIEPGYLMYNAVDPEGTFVYDPESVIQGTSQIFGPYLASPGTTFQAEVTGTSTDLAIAVGAANNGDTVVCASTSPSQDQTCEITADPQPVWIHVTGEQQGQYTLSVSWTPAPR